MKNNTFLLFLMALSPLQSVAEPHPQETLVQSGVTLVDGLYFCEAMNQAVNPDVLSEDVAWCNFATQARKICGESPATRWQSGRCFCPSRNDYLTHPPLIDSGITFFGPERTLNDLKLGVKLCEESKSDEDPIVLVARSVRLTPMGLNSFRVSLIRSNGLWDDRSDYPGEQGDPHYPASIATAFKLRLGFEVPSRDSLVIPNLNSFLGHMSQLRSDVGFYPTQGQVPVSKYLRGFLRSQLPLAEITPEKDPTYFLHDLNFHTMGLLFLPKEIREFSQSQTQTILDFGAFYRERFPELWAEPKNRILFHRLMEDQASRIDVSTGNLAQALFLMTEGETCADKVLSPHSDFTMAIDALKTLVGKNLHDPFHHEFLSQARFTIEGRLHALGSTEAFQNFDHVRQEFIRRQEDTRRMPTLNTFRQNWRHLKYFFGTPSYEDLLRRRVSQVCQGRRFLRFQ